MAQMLDRETLGEFDELKLRHCQYFVVEQKNLSAFTCNIYGSCENTCRIE